MKTGLMVISITMLGAFEGAWAVEQARGLNQPVVPAAPAVNQPSKATVLTFKDTEFTISPATCSKPYRAIRGGKESLICWLILPKGGRAAGSYSKFPAEVPNSPIKPYLDIDVNSNNGSVEVVISNIDENAKGEHALNYQKLQDEWASGKVVAKIKYAGPPPPTAPNSPNQPL